MRTIVFHSENGPHIGGSDLIMGTLADALDPAAWRVLALVRPEYPIDTVFRTCRPERIGDAMAANSGSSPAPSDPARRRVRWRVAARALVPMVIRRLLGYRRSARRVAALLRSARADILVSMDGGPQPAVFGGATAGCQVIAIHSAPPPVEPDWLTRWYTRQAAGRSATRVAMSGYTARAWERYAGLSHGSFRVVLNGVELPPEDPTAGLTIRAELDIPAEAMVVGMTGRMQPEKGPLVFARAAVRLAGRFPDALFVFTGDGVELPAVRAEFDRAGLTDRLRLLGFRTDAPRVAAAYDVAVVPSVFPEPFGLVAAEAMVWSRPVVASRVGGLPEVVTDGETGVLVPPEDDTALADAVAGLLADPARRIALGVAGRKRVAEHFTRDQMIANYLNLFKEILSGVGR